MLKRIFPLLVFLTFSPPLTFAEEMAGSSVTLAQKAVDLWKGELPNIRLETQSVRLPQGWPPDFTIKPVEELFNKPFETPVLSSSWLSRLGNASELSDITKLSADILFESTTSLALPAASSPGKVPPLPAGVPPELGSILETLYRGLAEAREHLKTAVDSIGPQERRAFLNFLEMPAENGLIKQEISSRRIKKMLAGMKNFKEEEIFMGGREVFAALDQVLPRLQKLARDKFDLTSPITWPTPAGNFLIKGKANDSYSEEDLKANDVIIDLGGENSYSGPAAGATEYEIRILVDLGSNLNFEARRFANTNIASGIFGIGVLVLPNPEGIKKFTANSFSEGCGIGGIGALFITGRADLKGDRYSQGVGAFGLGVIKISEGDGSTFEIVRNGQGAGFVRGIGIFSLEGDDAAIKGGLVEPDPREPLGTVSICQGVGFGPRAYAGGGIGIMSLKGNRMTVHGSYFAQGTGYWHGLGIFRLEGNQSEVQARRYDQGTGVHYAFGHFELKGNKNRILNWGVGPAFGWDRGLGSALFEGNENELQTEWGAGAAAIGSWSLSYIQGDKNLLQLPQWGEGGFFRNEFARSIHIIEGENNLMKSAVPLDSGDAVILRMGNPWGLCQTRGTDFRTDLNLKPPEWATLSNEEEIQREEADLDGALKKSRISGGLEKVAGLLDVAGAFSLDKTHPRSALGDLLTLPKKEVPYLVEVYDPVAVDSLVKLESVLPAYGEVSAEAILERIDSYPLQKKVSLMSELANLPPSATIAYFTKQMKNSPEDIIRLSCARILGGILNQDTGNEPGKWAILNALADHLQKGGKPEAEPKDLLKLLRRLTFPEAFGILATSLDLSNEEKLRFLAKGPAEVNESLGEPGSLEFVALINKNLKSARKRVREELEILKNVEPVVQENLYELLESTIARNNQAAIIALGQLAKPADAIRLEPFLNHLEPAVREAAAVALGRMGEAGLPILKESMESESGTIRNLVLASIPHSVSAQSAELIFLGLKDPLPFVRLNAVTALKNLPPVFESSKEEIIRKAKRELSKESDPSVLLAIRSIQ